MNEAKTYILKTNRVAAVLLHDRHWYPIDHNADFDVVPYNIECDPMGIWDDILHEHLAFTEPDVPLIAVFASEGYDYAIPLHEIRGWRLLPR